MANFTIDSDDNTLRSRSMLNRRHLPNHANVLSTVQRIGRVTQPWASLGRRTMVSFHCAFCATHSYRVKLWYLLSAYMFCTRLNGCPFSRSNNWTAPLPSSRSAAVTKTASSNPMLSTTIWRFRPSTFLALSRPRASPPVVVSTDWLSTLADVRGAYGFSAVRTFVRSKS
jgi:hypothetical protein